MAATNQVIYTQKLRREKVATLKDYINKIRAMNLKELLEEFELLTDLQLSPETLRETVLFRLITMKIDATI